MKYLLRKQWTGFKVPTQGILVGLFFLLSCVKPSVDHDPEPSGFDKAGMLAYYADSLILPSYNQFQTNLNLLETATNAFLENPGVAQQEILKSIFKNTYIAFEHVSVNQIGPAENVLLGNFLNTFPADTAAIETNVANGSVDLSSNFSISQQGFPALDYFLFNSNAIAQLTDINSAFRKKYIKDIIIRMKSLTGTVVDTWKNSYRTEFVNNASTNAGSPIAAMVNQIAFEMDQMKGQRIGWPYGKQSGGVQYPQNTEGYYSGISVALAIENLKNLRTMFTGNNSGKGFADYLNVLNKKQLSTDVASAFDATIKALEAIPDPLSTSLKNNTPALDTAYRDIQLLLTLIKADMATALGVRISYQDSDGD